MKYLLGAYQALLDAVRSAPRTDPPPVTATPPLALTAPGADEAALLDAARYQPYEAGSLVPGAGEDHRIKSELAEHFTRFWTRLMTARVDSTARCISEALSILPNHEAVGRRMIFLVQDYADGLMSLARGEGAASQRAALAEIASEIAANVERVQRSGHRLFVVHGMSIASAAREAVRARSLGVARASLAAHLSPEAVAEAARARSWGDVGVFAASLGAVGAFGVTATAGAAMAIAALAAVGSPAAVSTFVLAGGAAFGGRLGSMGLGRPHDIERILAEWTASGARGVTTPDAPPASATYPRAGSPRHELEPAAPRARASGDADDSS